MPPSSPSRPERKFIRFASVHSPDADERAEAAEREVLQREYLNSQGRAGFYEANPEPARRGEASEQVNVADIVV